MSDWQQRFVLVMTGLALTLFLALAILTAEAVAELESGSTLTKYHGCALDAERYDPPAFAGNDEPCYKVMDRATGNRWWLVRMDEGWVSMPILPVKEER